MKEIRVKEMDILDDVVEKLIKERENGRSAYAIFEDVRLDSRTVTLDNAYLAVSKYTKDEFSRRNDGARAFNGMKKMFGLTPENVIKSVKMAKYLFLTKYNDETGKTETYDYTAEDYINKLNKYSEYCPADKCEDWKKQVKKVVYGAGSVKDDIIIQFMRAYEVAGEVMKSLRENKSWQEISNIARKYSFDPYYITCLGKLLLEFSKYGLEFIDNVVGDEIDYLTELRKLYDDEVEKRKSAYTAFANIAMNNSRAYSGSSNFDEKVARTNKIKEALRDARYRESFAYHNSSDEPLNEGKDESSCKKLK